MRLLLLKVLSYFPQRLPVGVTEFEAWADNIIALSGKFADTESMKFALSSQILHLPAQSSSVPPQYFIRSMRKAAANQVASQVFQDIKIRQQEAAKAAVEAAKKADDEAKTLANNAAQEALTQQAQVHAAISVKAADLSLGKQPVEVTTQPTAVASNVQSDTSKT